MRPNGACVGLYPESLTAQRSPRSGNAHRNVRPVQAGTGGAASTPQFLFGLADRSASSFAVDVGPPVGANRLPRLEEPADNCATRLAGSRVGTSRTWNLLQVTRDQYRAGPSHDVGAVRPR